MEGEVRRELSLLICIIMGLVICYTASSMEDYCTSQML